MKRRQNPCSTCPYLKTTPSGLWAESEYQKLPNYDKETCWQPPQVFMCHSDAKTESICEGWIQCHGNQKNEFDLISARLAMCLGHSPHLFQNVKRDESVFASGQEAMLHGMKDMTNPDQVAIKKIKAIKSARIRFGK